MLVVIMGMLIFSGLAYVSEKDEENTMFISMPQVIIKKPKKMFLVVLPLSTSPSAFLWVNFFLISVSPIYEAHVRVIYLEGNDYK